MIFIIKGERQKMVNSMSVETLDGPGENKLFQNKLLAESFNKSNERFSENNNKNMVYSSDQNKKFVEPTNVKVCKLNIFIFTFKKHSISSMGK